MKKIVIISVMVLLIIAVVIIAISVPNQTEQSENSGNEEDLNFLPDAEGENAGGNLDENYQDNLPNPSEEPREDENTLTVEYCELLTNQTEKDNCWTDLANQISEDEENETKAAEICKKIVDIQSHDSCLDDVSFDILETCEAMKTKDSDPKDWYNDCIDFVAYYAEDCLRIKNDDKLEAECIEFTAETVEECNWITIENIRERCKRNL